MLEKNIDNLVLGCTHYYFLKDILEKLLPKEIKVLDSSSAVCKRVKQVLESNNNTSETLDIKNQFYCNGNKSVIQKFLRKGKKINKIIF
jgi:glutamate racemase